MTDQRQSRWARWFYDHGVRILILVAIGVMAVMYANSRSRTVERLDAIEDTVQHQPPRSYKPPDMDAYAAKGVSAESLRVHQSIYVPVYSHIYYDGGRPYLLEATLSVRNTNIERPIYVSSVDYYDTGGKLAREYVDRLIELGPLETIEFLVERHDVKGGSGANFIVQWHAADASIDPPYVEAIMVGRSGTNAISFESPGRPLPQK